MELHRRMVTLRPRLVGHPAECSCIGAITAHQLGINAEGRRTLQFVDDLIP